MRTIIEPPDRGRLIARAVRAAGTDADLERSHVHAIGHRRYVALAATTVVNGEVRATETIVYRVEPRGALRRMQRPPRDLIIDNETEHHDPE